MIFFFLLSTVINKAMVCLGLAATSSSPNVITYVFNNLHICKINTTGAGERSVAGRLFCYCIIVYIYSSGYLI